MLRTAVGTVEGTIPAMMCGGCEGTARGSLDPRDSSLCSFLNIEQSAVELDLNFGSRCFKVTLYDTCKKTDDEIKNFVSDQLKDVGFRAIFREKLDNSARWKGLIGTSLGLILFVLSMCGVGPLILAISAIMSMPLSVYLGWETFVSAWYAMWDARKITVDTLFCISTITMLVASVVALACPALLIKPCIDMVLLVFGVKYINKAIQEYVGGQLTKPSILNRVPSEQEVKCIRKNETKEENVNLKNLQKGDTVFLSGGHYVPVDVTCVEACAVTASLFDGQDKLTLVAPGAPLRQGMIIAHGTAAKRFTVDKTYQESFLYKASRPIENLQNENKNVSTFITYLVPVVVTIALVTGIVCWWLHLAVLPAIMCVLTAACPCSLGLNPGLSEQVARLRLEKERIPYANIKISQKPCKHLFADLNGTLTEPTPSEIKIIDLKKKDQAFDLNKLIYQLEDKETHPYAIAICEYLGGDSFVSSDPQMIARKDRSNHSGIAGWAADEKYYCIGNKDMMGREADVYQEEVRKHEGGELHADYQYIYITEAEKQGGPANLIGYVKLKAKMRPDAKATIKYFQDVLHMQVHVCTGADLDTAKAYLASADIQDVIIHAGCTALPEKGKISKVECVQAVQQKGEGVLGLGDGVNDAYFLSQCDVGVAMKSPVSDGMTEEVANFSIKSLEELQTRFPRVDSILKEAAQFKNRSDLLSCGLSFMAMLIPMLLKGSAFLSIVGPTLMFLPLVGVGAYFGACYVYYRCVEPQPTPPVTDFPPSSRPPSTTYSLSERLGLRSPTQTLNSSPTAASSDDWFCRWLKLTSGRDGRHQQASSRASHPSDYLSVRH